MNPKELFSRTGGTLKLSRALGLRSHSSLLRWKQIPHQHCPTIERAFGIPRHELRPDLFGPADVGAGADRSDAA